jgi:hypothetical protein
MYLSMHSGGWAIDGRTQAWSAHDDALSALDSWAGEIERQRVGRWRKASVTLWLSGGLARPFLCGPVAGLAGWGEAEAMANAMAPEATGFDVPCRVRLEDWPGDASVLGTAVDAAVAQAVVEVARARRLAWASVRPRWAGLLDEALARYASVSLIACAEEDALTVLGGATSVQQGAAGEFELAATYSPAPAADRSTALWNRTMLSRDVRPEDAWFARVETPGPELGRPAAPDAGVVGWPEAVRRPEGVLP